jgi:hypothetical protein
MSIASAIERKDILVHAAMRLQAVLFSDDEVD